MDRNFAAVTVFTLLFAVSTARISLDPTPAVLLDCDDKSLPESHSNLVVLPIQTTKSGSDGADQVQKSENDKMFRVDLTPRSDFARFHAINRHFFAHPRPFRHFVMPRSEISNRNQGIVTSENGNFDVQNLQRHGPSSSRLKFKHDYGHHHRHQHQHHHIHHNNNNKDVSMPKHKLAREKVKRLVQQHKEQTNEHKASFMRSIRKFLKHTFD